MASSQLLKLRPDSHELRQLSQQRRGMQCYASSRWRDRGDVGCDRGCRKAPSPGRPASHLWKGGAQAPSQAGTFRSLLLMRSTQARRASEVREFPTHCDGSRSPDEWKPGQQPYICQ